MLFIAFQLTESEVAKQIVHEVLSMAIGEKEQILKPSYKEMNPYEVLNETSKNMVGIFETLGLNIPKELILSTAILGTTNMVGYEFDEMKMITKKEDEESYQGASSVLASFKIKRNRVNETLILLGLQQKGTTTMQKFVLTEKGKEFGVERPYSKGGHNGYAISWKESVVSYIDENLDIVPREFFSK
ncbi:MAG: hypothetical protein ACRCTC_06825 [Cetobacterium sp.]